MLHCSTDVSLPEDLCNFLDAKHFVTVPTSEKQNSITDINIFSDSEIKNAFSVFRKTIVLLTDRCSTIFINTVQTMLRLKGLNKICLFFCDTDASYVNKFKGDYLGISTSSASLKSHALNFLMKPNGMFYSILSFMLSGLICDRV